MLLLLLTRSHSETTSCDSCPPQCGGTPGGRVPATSAGHLSPHLGNRGGHGSSCPSHLWAQPVPNIHPGARLGTMASPNWDHAKPNCSCT